MDTDHEPTDPKPEALKPPFTPSTRPKITHEEWLEQTARQRADLISRGLLKQRDEHTPPPTTFGELREFYTRDELSHFPGDDAVRYEAFPPVFRNLFEDKLVYRERFVCLVKLHDIEITDERFSAIAEPIQFVEMEHSRKWRRPGEPWSFSGTWGWMCLSGNFISVPHGGWSVWPEADRVREVERLLLAGDHMGAWNLTAGDQAG